MSVGKKYILIKVIKVYMIKRMEFKTMFGAIVVVIVW